MLNRATQITYAPGPTFKPFVALAAEGGDRVAGRLLRLPGRIRPPGRRVRRGLPQLGRDGRRHAVDRDGLKISCDTQYYMGEPVLQP